MSLLKKPYRLSVILKKKTLGFYDGQKLKILLRLLKQRDLEISGTSFCLVRHLKPTKVRKESAAARTCENKNRPREDFALSLHILIPTTTLINFSVLVTSSNVGSLYQLYCRAR